MGKKIYVHGNILVSTPFFRYKEATCLMDECPDDAEVIECNSIIEGQPVLEITEKFAPSIYNEYYAERGFVIKGSECKYFWNDPESCYETFNHTMTEIETLIHEYAHLRTSILYKHLCVALVAAFETYVCDTMILGAVNERRILIKLLMDGIYRKDLKIANNIADLVDMWCENKCGSAEIEAIWGIRECTFSNLKTVIKCYKKIYDIELKESDELKQIIKERHELAHRNGYRKDGTIIEIAEAQMNDKVSIIRDYVSTIHEKMKRWWNSYNKSTMIKG